MALDRQKLFGTDIGLREGAGGLDFVLGGPVGSSGDLTLAIGNDNIVQALSLRLRVRKGELAPLGWPDYGSRLHELIGEPDLARTRLKAQVFARDAVGADPRVKQVVAVDVVAIPGERSLLRLAMSVLLIDEPTPLDLVFDLALEGT
jgi:phage gp46-like protein